ncbi:MAG: DUF1330 domain-containing protein [Bacteroidota bacterium]
MNYLDATQEAGKRFFQRGMEGPVVMLNLLRFRKWADYSKYPDLDPDEPISGQEAYKRYMNHTLPLLTKAGGKLLFFGKGGPFLIGPEQEYWDSVLLVQHASSAKFLSFATDTDYLAIAGHRTAALIDSRLLPIEQKG